MIIIFIIYRAISCDCIERESAGPNPVLDTGGEFVDEAQPMAISLNVLSQV